jgi:plasmid segregation protein ParM
MPVNIIAAVDSGYGYGLGRSEIREVIISNFIRKITEDDAKTYAEKIKQLNQDNIIMKYQGTYYAVGNLAVKADPKIKRNPTNDRIDNSYHLIEILSILGLLCDSRNYTVDLIVGLPNKLRSEKKKMVKWLNNKFEFSYLTSEGEIFKSVEVINVACVEQAVSAIYNLDKTALEGSNVISIDLGHSTLDCVYVSNSIVSLNASDWISADGVKWCYDELAKKLVERFRDEYQLYEVLEKDLQTAIEVGIFKIHNEKVDIQDLLNSVFEDYADMIYNLIADKYSYYLPTVEYIIASGGMMSNQNFYQRLAKKFKHYNIQFAIFPNPQKSIVNGMYVIGQELYGEGAGEEVAVDEEQSER